MVLKFNYNCQLCNKQFENCTGLTAHLKFKHKNDMSYETYYLKYMNTKSIPGECVICGMPTKFENLNIGYAKTCSRECGVQLNIKNQKLDNYAKAKLTRSNTLKEKYNIKTTEIITSPFSIKEVQNKSKNTFHKLYGENIDNPFQVKEIIEKIESTMETKYGGKTTLESNLLKNKYKQTMKTKYGANHPSQSHIIQAKIKRKYKYNNIFFDSSWEVAYYIWLIDNKVNFIYHPKPTNNFKYYWKGDNKIHTYFPDFKIEDEYIEIKNSNLLYKMINFTETKDHYKYNCMLENNVKIISDENIKFYLDYIENKYNKYYLENFRYNKEENNESSVP